MPSLVESLARGPSLLQLCGSHCVLLVFQSGTGGLEHLINAIATAITEMV